MRYKIGDRVRVINVSDERRLEALGAIGIVVDIDAEWTHPYEIDFEDEDFKKFNDDLFLESELIIASEEKVTPQSDTIHIKFQKNFEDKDGASLEDVLEILIDKVKEMHNNGSIPIMDVQMNNMNIISKLKEAKMWLRENRKIHEKYSNTERSGSNE